MVAISNDMQLIGYGTAALITCIIALFLLRSAGLDPFKSIGIDIRQKEHTDMKLDFVPFPEGIQPKIHNKKLGFKDYADGCYIVNRISEIGEFEIMFTVGGEPVGWNVRTDMLRTNILDLLAGSKDIEWEVIDDDEIVKVNNSLKMAKLQESIAKSELEKSITSVKEGMIRHGESTKEIKKSIYGSYQPQQQFGAFSQWRRPYQRDEFVEQE